MDVGEMDKLIRQLTAGFEALQDEYQKLFGSHVALERKLATAREQYNQLAKLFEAGQTSTPPLSLSSLQEEDPTAPTTATEMLKRSSDRRSNEAANMVKTAIAAAKSLRHGVSDAGGQGVKIWGGPSADRLDNGSSLMPSISESPLEQDFTVEGKPSKLGCPFASMASKKNLSSHAASVLSRYNQSNSIGAHGSVGAASTPISNASRVNGKESLSRRQSRKGSFVDPIKAEICGLSDHDAESPHPERKPSTSKEPTPSEKPTVENADVGVCPIRFLDQHSPEEVATYFEKHKHELPRSHEVCVMRYQSNEDQIKELDAKYGNLVSMIQGLGQKHKDMLPEEPDEDVEDEHPEDVLDDAKVRKWASSVSAQAPGADAEEEDDERLAHFERPLRDIRVGESPSRPWGIPVPAKYLDLDGEASQTSSKPAVIAGPAEPDVPPQPAETQEQEKPKGKCPFDHEALKAMGISRPGQKPADAAPEQSKHVEPKPAVPKVEPQQEPKEANEKEKETRPQIVFNGPVFIGYSPEDAVRFLREAGARA
ncbi:hypothetical protein PRZ48_005886 [Zasmidium cellare]|uniref:Uncharacterized protein n=1 Tax=Zasmidium cellare TaxID=395010 RepID=A0ABR0EMS5_ZASCE|nr:hypothetical protein PRZ48_005886 [Zasmidium cellare]